GLPFWTDKNHRQQEREDRSHDTSERELRKTAGKLFVFRDRKKSSGLPGGSPGDGDHPPGDRRRDPAAGARDLKSHASGGGRDGPCGNLPRLRAGAGLSVFKRRDRQGGFPEKRLRYFSGRDLYLRRSQVRRRKYPGAV